jgi:hypothetical protein
MTTEERLRHVAQSIRSSGARRIYLGEYLDELLDRAAAEMDKRTELVAGLSLSLAIFAPDATPESAGDQDEPGAP